MMLLSNLLVSGTGASRTSNSEAMAALEMGAEATKAASPAEAILLTVFLMLPSDCCAFATTCTTLFLVLRGLDAAATLCLFKG